jgi:chromosome segregation ATPase
VRLIDALEGALAALRTRAEADAAEIERLRTAVDRAEQGRDAERVRADALADQANIMQAKLATAEVVVDQARRDARAAQDQVEQLRQADAERRARGVLSRLRAAWRGE